MGATNITNRGSGKGGGGWNIPPQIGRFTKCVGRPNIVKFFHNFALLGGGVEPGPPLLCQ